MRWSGAGASRGRLDYERLRAQATTWDDAGAEVGATSPALPSFLGQVVSASASIHLNEFCQVAPTMVLGAEVEGGPGVINPTAADSTTLVLLLGTHVPKAGDYLVCRFVDHRWVAETTGSGNAGPGNGDVTLPNCFCPVPPTLAMVSASTTCNYGMFQSTTLTYGPAPAALQAIGLTISGYFSQASFVDPITGEAFYYYFSCRYNQFYLTRIFPNYPDGTPEGSPFFDGILYSWTVGGYGNQCSPFQLLNGTPFPGSDAECSVQITG